MTTEQALLEVDVSERLLDAARNATTTCLAATTDDRAVIIFDASTRPIAAALLRAFEEIGTAATVLDMDSFGKRPHASAPAQVINGLKSATVSAMAIKTLQGELSVRRAILNTVNEAGVRHAHMPSITVEMFEDSLSMDYREVSRFITHCVETIAATTSLTMTSAGGTQLDFSYPSPPTIDKLDGLIEAGRWQNIPSGQILIYPTDANGLFVADRTIGDWFEHKYDVSQYPVTFEFEDGYVRRLSCENRRLERDLWVYVRSSENSNRISELVIGANLGLTQDHAGALFDGYRPGASIAIGSVPSAHLNWDAATFLPMVGRRNSIVVGERQIMVDDSFSDDILSQFGQLKE
jgi:leucyl aminopeptidase (aminopeptidase T)